MPTPESKDSCVVVGFNVLSYYSRYQNKSGNKYLKKEQVAHLYVTRDKSFEDVKDISLVSMSKTPTKRCKCECSAILILGYINVCLCFFIVVTADRWQMVRDWNLSFTKQKYIICCYNYRPNINLNNYFKADFVSKSWFRFILSQWWSKSWPFHFSTTEVRCQENKKCRFYPGRGETIT